ncbi:hypothetical protein [Bradyrhizobium sp. SZCCHNR1015]|uniref:hypothetical protein n=1 Tax=Bradyrhizobium sp. SZCCHNR1015 TaxID=3057338 RepID=UPI002916D273|nr:hypothetical protein [Bradyrhizobium sp. SZCCHNR1015]
MLLHQLLSPEEFANLSSLDEHQLDMIEEALARKLLESKSAREKGSSVLKQLLAKTGVDR